MYLNKVSASTGALWFRRGITLFFKSPLVFLALNLAYLLITMATALIPVVHVFASFLILPFFSVLFMTAAARPALVNPSPFICLARFSKAMDAARLCTRSQCWDCATCRKCIGFDNLRIAGRRKTHANRIIGPVARNGALGWRAIRQSV